MAELKTPNLNKVLISGRITKDIELKFTPKGTACARFSIASERRYKDGDEWKSETTFVTITAWSGLADMLSKQCRKGTAVIVEGRLECQKYEQEGVKHERWGVLAESVHVLEWLPKGDITSDATPPVNDNEPF